MTPLDPDQLLGIDVGAEIRKLAEAQIESAWQLPAELVRLALRAAARTVEVSIGSSRVTLDHDGPGLPPLMLPALADLLDEGLSPAVRHRALGRLESASAFGLIALAGLGYSRLRVETPGGALDHRRGRRPQRPEPRAGDTRVEIDGLGLQAERARAWLEAACRFTPVKIRLDGRDLRKGFRDALVEDVLAAPVSGRIALPRTGDTSLVWLLQDGLVAAHVTVADAPCFEAVLEMPKGPGPVTAAALRDAAAPHLDALAIRARDLALLLGGRIDSLDDSDQRRVRHLLLKAALSGAPPELLALPLFPALVYQGAPARRFSLLELGRAAEAEGGRVAALYPDQDPTRCVPSGRVAFVLDAQERSALSQLLGLAFCSCVPRPASRSLRARLASGLAAASARAQSVLLRLRHPREGPPVEAASLSVAERALLAGLAKQLDASLEVRLGQGQGPLRRPGGRYWLLPRRNTLVRAGLRLTVLDPRWLYPAALAFFEGRARPQAEAGLAWRAGRPLSASPICAAGDVSEGRRP
jgi:hypothetical protein